jgi:hypothetical protein
MIRFEEILRRLFSLMMRQIMVKKTVLSLILLIVLFQFVPVQRTNPSVEAALQVNPQVSDVLKKACFDCHSHETVWPWYSRIAPVSWLIAHDVNHGRKYINFSAWELMNADDKNFACLQIRDVVEKGDMPLKSYTLLHRRAYLTDADKQLIYTWVDAVTAENDRVDAPLDTSDVQH